MLRPRSSVPTLAATRTMSAIAAWLLHTFWPVIL
jgi:hypothetical protein